MGIGHLYCAIFSTIEIASSPEEQPNALRGVLKKYKRPSRKTSSLKDNRPTTGSRPLEGAASEAITLECCDTPAAKDPIPENPTKIRHKLNQRKRKANRVAARRSRLKRKLDKKAEDAGDELLEALVGNDQTGIRGKRQYTYGLVELVARIGSFPSASGARAPLAGIIPHIEDSCVFAITNPRYRMRFYVCVCYLFGARASWVMKCVWSFSVELS